MNTRDDQEVWCPSAQPDWPDAKAFAVVGGTVDQPRVQPLKRAIPVTLELLELAGPVAPTEVFRFGAPCQSSACQHFANGRCSLAAKIARELPPVVSELPACTIRSACRWFAEEGKAACLRCPQVVTDNVAPSKQMAWVANPETRIGESMR